MRFSVPAVVLTGLLALVPVASQADAAHTITVSGSGEARGAPDQAQLSAGVTTVAPTAAAALAENARTMTNVFDTLTRLGIPERAIQTSNFSVSPQYPPYNQNDRGLQKIVGYQITNQVNVTLDDTRKLGLALDALVNAGANQINSVSYSIRNADALEAKAQEQAVTNARARAETYAKAAGVTLGGVVSISEVSVEAPRPVYRAMAAQRVPATPTAAGEQSVTANVTVIFEIK
ncbi:MAG: SIMPL domain-containing protein [Alphaproteobacteria bacterium]|nr:SIMPL domain-containing protein [Alphaproteobacteria bacterium]MBL6938511.1 SIMPL domain-containing protein [Alphaproteobacteria bacterium]MBL7096570.1 SIMPL domain-containing protein [Alphaproteobacteria bacterium]